MKNVSKRRGFTLIELMIVIAIIGILAAIAVPNFRKAREQARTKACHANQRVLMGAVEMYNMDNATGMNSLSQATLIANNYLRAYANCPEAPDKDYGSSGSLTDSSGKISCPVQATKNDHNLVTQ